MQSKKTILSLIIFIISHSIFAQNDSIPFTKDAIKENRIKQYNNAIKNSIHKNLSLPLTDSTEEYWQDAFWTMIVMQYKSSWTKIKINEAFDSISKRSSAFQISLLELIYVNYKSEYNKEVEQFINSTNDPKTFAMSVEYLMAAASPSKINISEINTLLLSKFDNDTTNAIIKMLIARVNDFSKNNFQNPKNILKEILSKEVFKNSVVVYSFQRKDRDYPGLAIVRDKEGNFIIDKNGAIISIPQLARSVTNFPGYLTNGNTPEGIFRMDGFDTSLINAIGPTTNIQLTMPYENTVAHFLKDTTIKDSIWNEGYYKRLLPESWKSYEGIYQTYYASKAGRTEIIAHGTTVDPEYYRNKPYYPYTPTQGCLCTKEIWSEKDGKRLVSGQQKLADAVQKAGGADGYLMVIELDDKKQPVTLEEVYPFLPK